MGERELPNAVALNSSLFNASRILGPAIAGLVIGAVGVGACFAVNALTFLAVLASLLMLRESELFAVERNAPRSMVAGVREGLAFARHTRMLMIVLGVVTVLSVAGFNFHVIVPLLASDTLRLGPEAFGFLSAAFGAGALAGALAAAALGRASRRAFLLGTAGFGGRCSRRSRRERLVVCAAALRRRHLLHVADGQRQRARSTSRRRPSCAAGCSASTCSRLPASRRWAACSPAGSSKWAAPS